MQTKEVKAAERGEGRGRIRTGAIVIGIIASLGVLAGCNQAPAQDASAKSHLGVHLGF